MILDAAALADGTRLQADVCIVGGGAAGITVALGLIDSGLDVVLLESGGLAPDPATQRLYRGSMSGIDTFALDAMRLRYLGGSTNHWEGWCLPLTPEDFTPRDHIPLSGWPLRFEELVPYYERAQPRLDLGPFAWDAGALAASLGEPLLPAPGGMLATRVLRRSAPTRFRTRYQPALRAAERLRVFLNANVVRVGASAGRVTHLRGRVLGGPSFTAEAQRYVLALGGLENPRLMLASGVGNGTGWVGRCFMEHPHLLGSAAWLPFERPDLRFYVWNPAPDGPGQVGGAVGLDPATRAAEGLPDFMLHFAGVPLEQARTGDLPARVLSALWRGAMRGVAQVDMRAEQTPDPESRVTLAGERDALGMPRIDLHWRIRPEDLSGYRRGLELIGRELGAAGLGRLWTDHAGGRLNGRPMPGGHHMGTTRMSPSAGTGVVDRDCRCHEVDNLYVAGSSVFPTGGAANPTLTLVALAERLAEHLRSEAR